jgi:trehalose 6-phosphate synthase
MWTEQTLRELIEARLEGRKLIVVGQCESDQQLLERGPSGIGSVLAAVLRSTKGVWVAQGPREANGAAVDQPVRFPMPREKRGYKLHHVCLTPEEQADLENRFVSNGLWPLCHKTFARPVFEAQHFAAFCRVNERFASTVLEEAGAQPATVLIVDYRYALLPRMLRDSRANLVIAHFWEIPWPNADLFDVFPWKEELLEGLLGSDLLGFQVRGYCRNFLDTLEQNLECVVDRGQLEVTRKGRTTVVRPFPNGVDFDWYDRRARSAGMQRERSRWRDRLRCENLRLGIGIDRIDPTKGIPERLRAIDRFLESHPEACEAFAFVQIGVPSLINVRAFRDLETEIDVLVDSINGKWCTSSWMPIVYRKQRCSALEQVALHQLADFCMVSALEDGMNLSAKEFVASRSDEDGVLVLSRFTGAARELAEALLVNPFATQELVEAIHAALTMSAEERSHRMRRLRESVAENNVYRWAGKILSILTRLDAPEIDHSPRTDDESPPAPPAPRSRAGRLLSLAVP